MPVSISDPANGKTKLEILNTNDYERKTIYIIIFLLVTISGKAQDFNPGPENEMLLKELQEQIALVIDSLPPACRKVFLLSRFKNLKNREISEELKISTTAVEKHISRALSYFSKHFRDKYPIDVLIIIIAWILNDK